MSLEEIQRLPLEKLPAITAALIKDDGGKGFSKLLLACSRWAELAPKDGCASVIKAFDGIESGSTLARRLAVAGFLSTWLADQGRDPAELLQSIPSGRQKDNWALILAEQVMRMGTNPETIAKLCATILPGADVGTRIETLKLEGAFAPEASLTKLLELPDAADYGERRGTAINSILANASAQDPAEALRLGEKVPWEGAVDLIMGRALEKLTKDRPSAALDYIVEHPGPAQTTEFLKRWDYLLAAAGPEAVRAAAAKVEDPDIRHQILGHAAFGLAFTDPGAAAGLMGGMEADELVMPLWREVAAAFARLPVPRQEEWLNSLPPGPAREAAASAIEKARTGAAGRSSE